MIAIVEMSATTNSGLDLSVVKFSSGDGEAAEVQPSIQPWRCGKHLLDETGDPQTEGLISGGILQVQAAEIEEYSETATDGQLPVRRRAGERLRGPIIHELAPGAPPGHRRRACPGACLEP